MHPLKGNLLLAGTVVVLLLWLPATAVGNGVSSGEITTAEASQGLTTGHLAGWASWTGCDWDEPTEPPSPWLEEPFFPTTRVPCEWKPFVTVGPGQTEADCEEESRLPWSQGEAVSAVWLGQLVWTAGTQNFDLEAPLHGTPEELACLGFVETIYNTCLWEKGKICPQWYSASHVGLLDSAPLATAPEEIEEEEQEPDPEEVEGGGEEPESPEEFEEPEESEPVENKGPDGNEEGRGSGSDEAPSASLPPVPEAQPSAEPPRQCRKGQRRVHRAGHVLCKRHRHRRHHHHHRYASQN